MAPLRRGQWSLRCPLLRKSYCRRFGYFADRVKLKQVNWSGFKASFNPTYPVKSGNPWGWVSPWNYGLNQGPIVFMIENQRTGLIWRLMRQCPYIVEGLRRAGFRGGWL